MSNVAFDISNALYTSGGGCALTPNKSGVYEKIPLMVLGKVSRNNKEYELSSMLFALTSPHSPFYKQLIAGQLEGEWEHPLVISEADIPRLMRIERERVSHVIHRVYAGETTGQGHTVVYGDIEPSGPYGKYLEESFQNPRKNTAFSLRSLVQKTGTENGVIKQRVTALITVDAVACPGYIEASKVVIPGIESLDGASIDFNPVSYLPALSKIISTEAINDQELLDLLAVNSISIKNIVKGTLDLSNKAIISANGRKESIFHKAYGGR